MTPAQVVLVGPADSYRLGAYLRAVRSLGAHAVVVSDRPGGVTGSVRVADFGEPGDQPAVLAGVHPDAIVATDGVALGVAARLGQPFRLRTNPLAAVLASLDKGTQRRAVQRAGVGQPAFRIVAAGEDMADAAAEVGFPAVVKPLQLSAGRGVLRVRDPLDARAAAAIVGEMIPPGQSLLVERFVAGGEVAVEGLLDAGRFQVLAIFDKPGAPQGPTFPETVLVTPSRLPAETARRLIETSALVCATVGLRHGPVHIEFRIDGADQPQFIELAARTIGGRCASMLSFHGGVTLEELVLRQALGLPYQPEREPMAVGVHMLAIERSGRVTSISGQDLASSVPGITEVIVELAVGDRVTALPHGDRYAGFLFARGDSPDAVEASLAKAVDALHVTISAATVVDRPDPEEWA